MQTSSLPRNEHHVRGEVRHLTPCRSLIARRLEFRIEVEPVLFEMHACSCRISSSSSTFVFERRIVVVRIARPKVVHRPAKLIRALVVVVLTARAPLVEHVAELVEKALRREAVEKEVDRVRRELNRIQRDLNHVPVGARGLRFELVTKEDEVDARRKRQNDEGKGDDDEQGGQLPVALDVLPLQRRRVQIDLRAARSDGHGNDVRIAYAHDGKRAEIVDDQVNTLPLRIDVTGIGARGVAFDLAGRSTIAVQE